MKFTLSWLKNHLDTDASPEQIGEALTALGLELDALDDPSKIYAPFKVAYVESAEKHPDADRLKICTMRTIDGVQKVVCGAPNARAGMKGIFAPEGSYIPGSDMVLKKGVIRGVESCGMLVSAAEMALSDDHDGIIEVEDDAEIGTPLAQIFGLDDPVFTVDLTPNRVDCAGVRGIARDLAAAGLGKFKPLDVPKIKGGFTSPVSVKIEDGEGCPLFLGRYIRGVKNGASPLWLQSKLKAVGLRPISILVDITNYFSLDLCRPLHVYDANKITGDILVRKAAAGESFDALNDKSYTALGGEVAITDGSGLIGLGGIVGGVSTGSEDDTVDVFLEAAYFAPLRIARTGRTLGIESDARYRFERGIDPVFTYDAMELATQMILDLCGGEASEIVEAGALPQWEKRVDYDPSLVKTLIGMDVAPARQKEILTALGFSITEKSGVFEVAVPPWRGDIWNNDTDGRADLAEEIMRVEGLDILPAVSVRSEASVAGLAETPLLSRMRLARNALASRGFFECVTWSFMPKDLARHFGSNDNPALAIANPISAEIDQMRPSILPNLIQAAAKNEARGFGDAALCEVGPVFRTSKPDGQDMVAAGIRLGAHAARSWSDSNAARAIDAYDAKADALSALMACGAPVANAQIKAEAPEHFHPGRSGSVTLGKVVLASFGEIHPAILDEMDIQDSVVGFEIYLQNIPEARNKTGTEKPYLTLLSLQPLSRDFAFIVDTAVEADALVRAAKAADKKLIAAAYVFDVYTGKGVEEGKKSLALNVTLQPQDKTLTDKDIEQISQAVIASVFDKTGGVLRG
ncbi:MAG: phenylalanine--tRNA ligase subunit beta [Alphaproteobacteria bacterium]